MGHRSSIHPLCAAVLVAIDLIPALALPLRQDGDAMRRMLAQIPPADREVATPENLKRIEKLERQFFFQLYPRDSITIRVRRLEKQIFGVAMHGSVNQRLGTLENSLTEKDPGTGRTLARHSLTGFGQSANNSSIHQSPPVGSSPSTTVTEPNSRPASPTSALSSRPIAPDGAHVQAVSNQSQPDSVLHISKDRYLVRGNPDSYIHQLNSAIEMNPQDPSLSFERAKALIQLSKWDRALNDLSDAVVNRPDNAEYYLARALVYKKMGNAALAQEDIRQARFYNPTLPAKIDFEEPGIASKK